MDEDTINIRIEEFLKRKNLNFDSFFKNKDTIFWARIFSSKKINIDLSNITFITHDGAVWIAYITAYRKSKGYKTDITLPMDNDVLSFLKGIHFSMLADGDKTHFKNTTYYNVCKCKYNYVNEYEKNLSNLISVNGLKIPNDFRKLEYDLNDYLLELPFKRYGRSNIGNLFKNIFTIPVTELIKNIIDYGGTSLGSGIGYCSLIPPIRTAKYIRYCFLDIGKGFKSTLLDKKTESEFYKLGKILTDKEAIIKGLLYRQSIKKENIIGLYLVLGMVCATHGSVGIRSGEAIVDVSFKNSDNYNSFKGNFFNGYHQSIDKNIEQYFQKIIKHSRCNQIPGSQIYIDLGLEQIDTIFLQDISDYLETRG